jgi:hypothetical protein
MATAQTSPSSAAGGTAAPDPNAMFLSAAVQLKEMLREEFSVHPMRFFKLFFADDSTFSHVYHEARGDKGAQFLL